MASLPGFTTDGTNTWVELPGVSGVAGNFVIQNKGSTTFFVYEGAVPNDNDSFEVVPQSNDNGSGSSAYIVNDTGAQIWVRSNKETRIGVNG